MTTKNRLLLNFDFPLFELLDELGKGSQLFILNKRELVNEVDKVFEGGVEMGLQFQGHDMGEVAMVDMGVDSE